MFQFTGSCLCVCVCVCVYVCVCVCVSVCVCFHVFVSFIVISNQDTSKITCVKRVNLTP